MGEDVEKGDDKTESKVVDNKAGMSQSSKDDIGVCVTILAITVLAIIVTSIKIVIIDMHSTQYAKLFGNKLERACPHSCRVAKERRTGGNLSFVRRVWIYLCMHILV